MSIHSDQGAAFESRVLKEVCALLQIRKTRTSARHPQGNDQVERFMRTFMRMVRAFLVGEQDAWDENLGCLAGAYRCTIQESTRLTPNMLVLGREVRMPAEVIFGSASSVPSESVSPTDYAALLHLRLEQAHEVARKHLHKTANSSKDIYDARMHFHQYQVGDLVWCLHETRSVGVCPKLERAYDGPYLIVKRHSPINFELQINVDGVKRVVHHNKIKPYSGREPPNWVLRAQKRLARM